MKALSVIGGIVLAVALVAAIAVAAPTVLKWGADVNREVTQHSQAYVESKTQLLNGLITDYEDPAATSGQKAAIVNEFCYQTTLLLASERPANVVRFQTAHC